jgi:hypothetical protein
MYMYFPITGSLWNPRILGVDVKMALYNIGAVGLMVNIFSCAAVNYYYRGPEGMVTQEQGSQSQSQSQSGPSLAMLLYTLMFLWFLLDYVTFEKVHLYTYGRL